MTLKRSDVIQTHCETLRDARNAFTDEGTGPFERHIDRALQDLPRVRPRLVHATLTLEAGLSLYDLPADFIAYNSTPWHARWRELVKRHHLPPLPRPAKVQIGSEYRLQIMPAPTASLINQFGSEYSYVYHGQYTLKDDPTQSNVEPNDLHLLLLRAQAEAMRELSNRNTYKPKALGPGPSAASNTTPAALYQQYMADFEAQAVQPL